jgi:hypothetical protein
MGKVITQASMSLDGFIADPNDQVGPLLDWYNNSPLLLDDPEIVQGDRVTHLRYRVQK